jgi:hypothetical protein
MSKPSKALFALIVFALMDVISVAAYADQRDSYDRRGWQNICRQRVRAKICPTGDCPKGTKDWREAQIERCMRHYANVRIRKPGEK